MIWVLLIAALAVLTYFYLVEKHKFWKRNSVPHGKSPYLLGDIWRMVFGLESDTSFSQRIYKQAGGNRYYGIYQMLSPGLVIKDPDLIKQITVKDFDHFMDHRSLIPDGADPLWSRNLLQLKGERWKDVRSTLSPLFTSSKMKLVFIFMSECAERFTKHFLDIEGQIVTVELKDSFTRYTNDIIASTSFGVRCDSLRDRDNEFYLMGKELSVLGFWTSVKVFLYMIIPSILKFFRVPLFTHRVRRFFRTIIKETIELRESKKIVRHDMIHLLLEARRNELKYDEDNSNIDAGFAVVEESPLRRLKPSKQITLSDDDITAQALIFFFGGFESTSTLMSFMGYELGVNPDVQARLRQEVSDTVAQCNGKVTYDELVKMKYLDMVISETLRKWPPFPSTDRVVTKPYVIEPQDANEKPVYLKKGQEIYIPTYGFHHDPKYYPNPEKFDPERFSDENKNSINRYTYLPFGGGPRNCVGSRFALLETKVLFFYLLSNFEIVPVEKTRIPVGFAKVGFTTVPEHDLWFGLKKRE